MCGKTYIHAGTGANRRVIDVGPIHAALGPAKAAALPGLHALSGADQTGKFATKSKPSWWNAFINADDDIVLSLQNLGNADLDEQTLDGIEKLVCKVYLPGTAITELGPLRW